MVSEKVDTHDGKKRRVDMLLRSYPSRAILNDPDLLIVIGLDGYHELPREQCVAIYEQQVETHAYFLHISNHPISHNTLVYLLEQSEINGQVLIQGQCNKQRRYVTNAPQVAIALERNPNVPIGRSTYKGIEKQAVLDKSGQAVVAHLKEDRESTMETNARQVSEKCHEPEIAIDGVSGAPLDPAEVRRARLEEIEYIRTMNLYTKVPIEQCWGQTRKGPIAVRWIDVNRQDSQHPLYRSRLVAKEFNTHQDVGMFAATPPLEAMRMIISIASTYKSEDYMVMTNDVPRALFYAPVPPGQHIYVKLPEEDCQPGEEHLRGKLNFSMYGTRKAAINWQRHYTGVLEQLGLVAGKANCCTFHHAQKGIYTLVHGDDFLSTWPRSSLLWMKEAIGKQLKLKSELIGPDPSDQKELKVLNRIIRCEPTCIELEADPRHAELIIKQLGLEEAKPLTTPATPVEANDETDPKELNPAYATQYKSIVARSNYLAIDRPDIQYAVQELAAHMAKPNEEHWQQPKRLGRYLLHRPRLVIQYPWQKKPGQLTVYSDSDWAGDKRTMKSTSGDIITIGNHYIKSWSKNQSIVALSSAEAELYGIIKASGETLGIMSILQDWGSPSKADIMTDASAAMRILNRTGLGKLRHVDTSYLWLQQNISERR